MAIFCNDDLFGEEIVLHLSNVLCKCEQIQEKSPLLWKSNSLYSSHSENYSEFYLPKCLVMIS